MARILTILAPGFEETEAITAIDLLRRADIEVVVAGTDMDFVTGSHHIAVKTDAFTDEIDPSEFDCLLLPGGQPGTGNLKNNSMVINLIRDFDRHGKWIAAICAAPIVLDHAGITRGKNLTSYPSEQSVFKNSNYLQDNVVTDGKLITSRGVGTAIDFALQIVEIFKGRKIRDELAKRILW